MLNMFTSMELKLVPLHSDLSDIGSVSEGEAVTGSAGIIDMVGTVGPRLLGR